MRIESLKIKNFKAFKDVEMRDIPNFCIIVGANASGKSTLFSLFGFLKEALTSNVHTALVKVGGSRGFDEVKSRNSSGNIEVELKYRVKQSGSDASPLITYTLVIGKDEKNHAIVEREVLKYRRGSFGRPWEFLNFSQGSGSAVVNEPSAVKNESDLERETQTLKKADILAVKGLAQFEKFPAVLALGDLIENWHISDIHVNQVRQEQQAGFAEHLSIEGENLSLVIDYFHQHHPAVLEKICKILETRVPGLNSVATKITETGQALLQIKDSSFEDPFLVRYVSDGTIKMLAYLVLLYDPEPHPLLCVEEPENQLYPELLEELAEEFRNYAKEQQVLVSTHSPDFLNAASLEEVFLLVKKNGYTTIKRAADDEQIKSYMEAGDKMGRLWKQGLFASVEIS